MKVYKNILAVALIAAIMGLVSCGPSAEEKAKEKAKADSTQKKQDAGIDSLANTMGGGNDAKVGPADTTRKKEKK